MLTLEVNYTYDFDIDWYLERMDENPFSLSTNDIVDAFIEMAHEDEDCQIEMAINNNREVLIKYLDKRLFHKED